MRADLQFGIHFSQYRAVQSNNAQSSISPAQYTVSQSSISPAQYTVSQSSISPAQYTVSQSSVSPAQYTVSLSSISPAQYTVSLSSISPAQYTPSPYVDSAVQGGGGTEQGTGQAEAPRKLVWHVTPMTNTVSWVGMSHQ